jgi:hypothetical protein
MKLEEKGKNQPRVYLLNSLCHAVEYLLKSSLRQSTTAVLVVATSICDKALQIRLSSFQNEVRLQSVPNVSFFGTLEHTNEAAVSLLTDFLQECGINPSNFSSIKKIAETPDS